MIEGLKIEIHSTRLKEHLADRAGYHIERRKWYLGQVGMVESLRAGGIRPEAVTNDPVSSLERSAKEHGERAAFFAFLADHLVLGETYRLSEADIGRLEFVARYVL